MASSLSKLTSRFIKDTSGGVALMVGLTVPVLFLAVGGSVDYTRSVSNASKVQSAMDSTVLALTRKDPGTFDLQTEGEELLASFLAQEKMNVSLSNVEFSVDGPKITGSADAETKTFFLTLVGQPAMAAGIQSSAIPPTRKPIEIALVLDVSTSMQKDLNGKSRIDRMKSAVNEMFDTLGQELPPGTDLSASLVPYSSSVNLSNYRAALKGGSVGGKGQPATQDVWAAERLEASNGNSYTLSDKPPGGNKIPFVTADEMSISEPSARMVELNDNIGDVRTDVSNLNARGWTAGHIGMVWGYYSLAPAWKNFWSNPPANYGKADKIIVLLSDGEFNTTYNIGDSPDLYAGSDGAARMGADLLSQNDNQLEADAYFQDVCKLARDNGITIYSVALNLDPVSEGKLNDCVSGQGAVYSADTAAELTAAFRNIALQLGQRRLTN